MTNTVCLPDLTDICRALHLKAEHKTSQVHMDQSIIDCSLAIKQISMYFKT